MHIRVKITRDKSGRVVTMDLEDYLKGVVPSEIKAETCPMEAQKAQAIAARTYAIRKTIDRRSKPYDVDDTAGYQAFGARPRHKNSDAAVEATRGLVLMYGGKLIDAVYTDSNGGRCVSSLERSCSPAVLMRMLNTSPPATAIRMGALSYRMFKCQ